MRFIGLKTCDTCRKAQKALRDAGVEFDVTDVRADGLSAADIEAILEAFGDAALNKASTTWRGLGEAEKRSDPAALLSVHPTLLKRPVITDGTSWTQGWKPDVQAKWLGV